MCVLTEGQRASQQTCNPTQVKVTEPEPQDEPDLSLRGDIRATGSPLSSSNLRNPRASRSKLRSVYFLLVAAWAFVDSLPRGSVLGAALFLRVNPFLSDSHCVPGWGGGIKWEGSWVGVSPLQIYFVTYLCTK